jgi:hypothetical protein
MNIADITPGHCHARAQRLVAELELVREEMGRTKDTRALPEIANAAPREAYFGAIAAWHKASRLSDEVGIRVGRPAPSSPALGELVPGHVHQLIEAVLMQVEDVKQLFGITTRVTDASVEASRQPGDVLVVLTHANRILTGLLERPFTPSDVYRTIALATAYASRLTNKHLELAPFERNRKPSDCYERLEAVLGSLGKLIAKRGGGALAAHGAMHYVAPSDVYDLAQVVLGEVAFLHGLTPGAAAVQPFEPHGEGHRLPAHCHQLIRTLDAQLASLA